MLSAFNDPPVPDTRRPLLTLGAPPLVHVGSICSIHMAADCAFGLVRVLFVIGPRNAAMTTTLLPVGIQIADFDSLATAILPINWSIDFIHGDYFSPPTTMKPL